MSRGKNWELFAIPLIVDKCVESRDPEIVGAWNEAVGKLRGNPYGAPESTSGRILGFRIDLQLIGIRLREKGLI